MVGIKLDEPERIWVSWQESSDVPPSGCLYWSGILQGFYKGFYKGLSSLQLPSRLDRADDTMVLGVQIQKLVARIKKLTWLFITYVKLGMLLDFSKQLSQLL